MVPRSGAAPVVPSAAPAPFEIDPADLLKAGISEGDINDKARVALAQLSDKIEVARRQAWADGLDFAVGPVAPEHEDPFSVRDIWAPQKLTVTCKAGPCPRSFEPPPGWVVYRNPDYRGPE